MNWQLLINPFTKFSEKKLFFFGIIVAFAGSYVAFLSSATFDGIIDVHLISTTRLIDTLKENMLNIIILSLLLFIYGKKINSKTRFIDILNCVLLFRIPFYFVAILVASPSLKNIENEISKNIQSLEKIKIDPNDIGFLLLFSILSIVLLVYAITLLFQGFKTATNAKTTQHYIGFGLIILFAEILSKTILPLI